MSENSSIEWTDHTFNPWFGCTKVSPGCDGCYAEALMDKRYHKVQWGPGNPRVRTSESNWRQPAKWNKAHEAFFAEHGRRQRVFCASLADVFDNAVDPAWRADLFDLIRATPNLDWLLLTKRIGNALLMLNDAVLHCTPGLAGWSENPLPNVWLGATIVNQEEADRDIPKLLAAPARVRFLSIEPMLGPVDLTEMNSEAGLVGMDALTGRAWHRFSAWEDREGPSVDWVIVGGESGHGARPFNIEWARSIVSQCKAAGVAVHVKQLGAKPVTTELAELPAEQVAPDGTAHWFTLDFIKHKKGGNWNEWPEDLRIREFPHANP